MRRTIFHIDVNSAFLSWEAVYRLYHLGAKTDLRTIVSAVGGDMAKRHGIILAKSLPAKKYNIKTGESIVEALEKCPSLVLVPPNYSLYERCSEAFVKILKEYTPDVEQYSVDECFMDMSGLEGLYGDPVEMAETIRKRIRDELGFTVNIGISENKLLAKMASDFTKPDKVHTLWREEIEEKMWKLPVSDLFFVGRATEKKLRALGIGTIGELAHTNVEILRHHLKKHGETVWQFANGWDISAVQSEPIENKGYGNSTTIPFDVVTVEDARQVLLGLAETVGTRLRGAGVQAEVLSVEIKYSDFSHISHQKTMVNGTNITNEIFQTAVQLFEHIWDGRPVRHLGIHTSKIREASSMRQMNLFDPGKGYEAFEKMDRAVDQIRRRYGIDSVQRASFLKSSIDHLSGGISREKRTVDYSTQKIQ